jgi:type IV secretory pathway TraG/TraD family ATPase VirD4
LLRFSVFVAVEQQGTLIDVLRLLTDNAYRDRAINHIQDEVVRSFWVNEFASWPGAYRTEAVSSVTNKLAPALASRKLRAVLASPSRHSLDIRSVLDSKGILIVNVSRGILGQDHSTLLGSLMLTAIEQAALSRADIEAESRQPHTLFLDEFQSLITPSTGIMLSESRKYALGLVLSHQFTSQLDPATYHAVIGNCGTLIALRVGLEDAVKLAPAFSHHEGQLTPADLCNLPNHTAYVRALIDGHPSRPFSLSTLPPPEGDPARAEIVRRTSQRRHAARIPATSLPIRTG